MNKKIQVDTKTFLRFWGVVIGIGLLALVLWQARTGLLLVGISLFLAIALNPIVNRITKMLPGKRVLGAAVAYMFVIGVLGLIISVIAPAIINEAVKFVSTLPQTIESANIDWEGINNFGENMGIEDLQALVFEGLKSFSNDFVANFGDTVINSAGALGSFIGSLILVLVMTFLMLIEGPGILKRATSKLGKNSKLSAVSRVSGEMADVVSKYVSGQVSVALINGIITSVVVYIFCLLFGIRAGVALPFGLITGMFCLIPLFGSLIGGIIVSVLLLFNSFWAGIIFFIYYFIYMQIEANLISPKIQSKGLKLPALIIIVSVTIGVYMFGLVGAIAAIPVAGCIKVLMDEFYREEAASDKKADEDVKLA